MHKTVLISVHGLVRSSFTVPLRGNLQELRELANLDQTDETLRVLEDSRGCQYDYGSGRSRNACGPRPVSLRNTRLKYPRS
jgi:hypothetical protein